MRRHEAGRRAILRQRPIDSVLIAIPAVRPSTTAGIGDADVRAGPKTTATQGELAQRAEPFKGELAQRAEPYKSELAQRAEPTDLTH